MDKIVLKDVHSHYDGEYEFDGSTLTNRELHTIKRLSGVRVGELTEALEALDTDVVLAIAVIALRRHGKPVDEDVLWDAQGGSISVQLEEAVDETDVPPPTQPPTEGGSSTATTSGDTSSTSSDRRVNGQSPTGTPPSDTSAISERLISAI